MFGASPICCAVAGAAASSTLATPQRIALRMSAVLPRVAGKPFIRVSLSIKFAIISSFRNRRASLNARKTKGLQVPPWRSAAIHGALLPQPRSNPRLLRMPTDGGVCAPVNRGPRRFVKEQGHEGAHGMIEASPLRMVRTALVLAAILVAGAGETATGAERVPELNAGRCTGLCVGASRELLAVRSRAPLGCAGRLEVVWSGLA